MRVWVSKEDIKNGIGCDANKCPIANALKRKYKDIGIAVGPHSIHLSFQDETKIFNLTSKSAAKVLDFDLDKGMSPGYIYYKES